MPAVNAGAAGRPERNALACGSPRTPRRRLSMLVVSVALGAGLCVQAQTGGPGHATREVQAIGQLEEALLQAIRERDLARIDDLLDIDFEMIVAQDPDNPVPREDWIGSSRKSGSGAWRVQHLSVRTQGAVSVASFQLVPAPPRSGVPPVFVVDTWRQHDAHWQLLSRFAAPVLGSRRLIPGDAPSSTIPNKQY
jgi:hypothetical protein